MANDGPDINEFLCFAVYSAGNAFNKIYRPLLDELGLTYAQYLVLAALWEHDDLTVGQIGERLFLESSTLSPLLKRLEIAGHLQRRRDEADERVVRVTLTEQGSRMRERARHIPGCVVAATGLDSQKLHSLKADIESLRSAFTTYAERR